MSFCLVCSPALCSTGASLQSLCFHAAPMHAALFVSMQLQCMQCCLSPCSPNACSAVCLHAAPMHAVLFVSMQPQCMQCCLFPCSPNACSAVCFHAAPMHAVLFVSMQPQCMQCCLSPCSSNACSAVCGSELCTALMHSVMLLSLLSTDAFP